MRIVQQSYCILSQGSRALCANLSRKMSNTKNQRNFFICLLFINFVNNCSGGICDLCACTKSEAARIINCEGKREIDNYTEIFDLLAFDDSNNVEKLILSKHEIPVLPLDAFRGLKQLKTLDLSENSIEIFEADIFKELKSLEELDFSFNVLKTLSGSVFDNTKNLLKLNLSNNQIVDLNDTTANQLAKLTHLDLSHNNLKTINSDFVKSLSNLEFLDVSFNAIGNLPGETLLQLRSLHHLRANNNLLKTISGEDLPESLKILSVGHNSIDSLPLNLSLISCLNIEDNSITTIEGEANWFKKVKHLNISGNLLTSLANVQFDQLRVFDISRNDLAIIPESLNSSNYPALEKLFIGGNPMRDLIFNCELRLRTLVAVNLYLLEAIDVNAFRNIKGVDDGCVNLTISQNPRLGMIKKGAFNGVTICSLDLSNNVIASISPDVIKSEGKFLAQNGIDLQGNPMNCNCESQWMLNDLVPYLYNVSTGLLDNFRCHTPIELSGTRMVHWFKWKNQVFCDTSPKQLSKMIDTAAVSSADETVTLETSRGMLAIVAAAMATLCILIIVGILIGRRVAIRRRRMNRRF